MNRVPVVLVLGASGLLGNAVFRYLCSRSQYSVQGTVRSQHAADLLPQELRQRLICDVDIAEVDALARVFERVCPDAVINCVGIVKHLVDPANALPVLSINSVLPHRLALLCRLTRARLIHISTDCVFSGAKGRYTEDDPPDATDLYGRSKLLGEVDDQCALTVRTSIVGPELGSARGLLGWFLSQHGRVKGFRRAIFSGLPTAELARVLHDFIIPDPNLHGVYHVSSEPISKYELLQLFARVYKVSIDIEPDEELVIDRSLDSQRFRRLTGYMAPSWTDLVRAMHEFG
jgi:dTDP-4-dehydrorhamnose reductase